MGDHLYVIESPRARFTFADKAHREQLVALVHAHEVDVLAAGPVGRLGITGGGTMEEVAAFVDLIEQVRAGVGRPLAAMLVHHDNKAGTVSGAWEGVPDTIGHVRGIGNGATRVEWEKARWSSELHGRTWKLHWREGEAYELDETPEVTEDDILAGITATVAANPGCAWRVVRDAVTGNQDRKVEVRDRLLDDRELVNLGGGRGGLSGGGMRLYLPADVPAEEAWSHDRDHGRDHGTPPPGEGPWSPVPDVRKGTGGTTGSEGRSGWCPRCERPLEPDGPGRPRCRCDDLDRWERVAGGES